MSPFHPAFSCAIRTDGRARARIVLAFGLHPCFGSAIRAGNKTWKTQVVSPYDIFKQPPVTSCHTGLPQWFDGFCTSVPEESPMTTSASSPVGQATVQSHSCGVSGNGRRTTSALTFPSLSPEYRREGAIFRRCPRTRRTPLCAWLALFLGAATQSTLTANPQTRYYGHEAVHDQHREIGRAHV